MSETPDRPAAVTDYTVDPERIRATCRMLLNSGDITPIGVRMIEEALPDGDA